MCGVIGFQIGALNVALVPLRVAPTWRRVRNATGLSVLFAALSLATMVTDMPGYYYAPLFVALTNVVVVPVMGIALLALSAGNTQSRRTP